jgi:molybdopterin-guanine dinucleotide biosynthesis protein B
MRAIGIAGWSGAGKTTLIARLILELNRRGLAVSTIKHTHHDFEIDRPGADTFAHREAGAQETLIASARRIALVREVRSGPEPSLSALLRMIAPVDLVLIEGFKRAPVPKIEVLRHAAGKAPLWPDDPDVVALASDLADLPAHLPCARLDDVAAIVDLVLAHAEDVPALLRRLAGER